jgi:SAM-dependent methyltransferase
MSATEQTRDIFHIREDADYARRLRDEAAFWDRPQTFGVDMRIPAIDTYQNERFTGDASVAWYETIPQHGTFRRGLALGTSGLVQEATILRQNPELHLTFCDIAADALEQRARELGREFPGRVATQQVDLNFVELPEEAYDVIVSASSVHHLTNLEHVAFQVNRGLTAEGRFFMQDYVGEAGFQFDEPRKRFYTLLFARLQARHPYLRSWRIAWADPAEFSPFEAIRANETLGIFRRYLDEVSVRRYGAVLALLLFLRPDAPAAPAAGIGGLLRWLTRLPRRRDESATNDLTEVLRRLGPELLWLDAVMGDSGLLEPGNAFAVYRKRGTA